MKKTGKLGLMVGAATIAMMSSAMAQATNADLESRIQALEERAMTDRTRLSGLEQQYNQAVWLFDNGRPTLASNDSRFTLAIRTRFQTDFATFFQDDTHPAGFAGPADLSTGVVMRRVYFGIEGRAFRDFAYYVRLNFGGSDGGLGSGGTVPAGAPTGSEGDGNVNQMFVSYVGIPNWHFSIGALEPTMMFEGSTSSGSLIFIERPEIDNIASDVFGGSDSRRGIEVGYAKTDALWAGDNLAITAVFSGARTGSAAGHGNGGDEQSQAFVRASQRLWSDGISNLQIGTTIAKVLYSGNAAGGGAQAIRLRDRPQIRVDGTRLIDTGNLGAKTADLIAFDAGMNWENFFVGGEWAQYTVDRQCGTGITVTQNSLCTSSTAVIDHPTFGGWYVEGSWILTGETRVYTPNSLTNETGGWGIPVPSRPFALDADSWGAWELVARYSSTDLNWHETQTAFTGTAAGTPSRLAGVPGGKEDIFDIGVNWYLNRNVRVMTHFSWVSVEKGIVTNLIRDNQDFNVLGMRVQFAT